MDIKTGIISILNYPEHPAITERIASWIGDAGDEDLFHIDIRSLAALCKTDIKEILEFCIRSVDAGVFAMEWVYHCPHCGGVAKESLSIHDATESDFCPACRVNFNNRLDDNVEVFFSIHPAIRQISPVFKVSYIKHVTAAVEEQKRYDWKFADTLRGVDIIQNPVFRELMGDETLLSDQSLELMRTTILFTDIKGSTQMYTDLGDSRAFKIVREHFRILFEVIRSCGGVPVKTIGDAVMGSFNREGDALEAALDAQKRLRETYSSRPKEEQIEVKMGIHTGPALIVTLNGKLDYFGSTVNTAARIQSTALPNEVVISADVFNNKENQKIISRYTKKIFRSKQTFKGLNGSFEIYHVPSL